MIDWGHENNYIAIIIDDNQRTTTTAKPDNEQTGNNNNHGINNAVYIKLTTQEVGEGYFHILFTVIYALYIGFALFHLHKNRFKLCIPCSKPRFHSKRMSMIIGYILLIITALFGFIFNLYLYEAQLIGDELIFCYFMSFSLFLSHSLIAMWLFHSWIQFNFTTVISS